MEKIIKAIFVAAVSVFALYISLLSLSPANSPAKSLGNQKLPKAAATAVDTFAKVSVNIDDQPLRDNPTIYQYDNPSSIVTMYVTIRKGNSSDNSNFTWQQINDFTRYFFTNTPDTGVERTDAIVQIGDDSGPLSGQVGYGANAPNATIELRGNTASPIAQE